MTELRRSAPKESTLVDKVHGQMKAATFLAAFRNDRIDAPSLFDKPPSTAKRSTLSESNFLVPTF